MHDNLVAIHVLSVQLFLLIYVVKALLLFANAKKRLEQVKKRVKVPEMILSLTFLGTGIALIVQMGGLPGWLHPKLTAVVLSIPLAIIGVKKEKKILLGLALLLLVYAYAASVTKDPALGLNKKTASEDTLAPGYDPMAHGADIYRDFCVQCHGMDGKLGLYSSQDLSQSALSLEARIDLITKGKNAMPAFEMQLSREDIEAVARYLDTLK